MIAEETTHSFSVWRTTSFGLPTHERGRGIEPGDGSRRPPVWPVHAGDLAGCLPHRSPLRPWRPPSVAHDLTSGRCGLFVGPSQSPATMYRLTRRRTSRDRSIPGRLCLSEGRLFSSASSERVTREVSHLRRRRSPHRAMSGRTGPWHRHPSFPSGPSVLDHRILRARNWLASDAPRWAC